MNYKEYFTIIYMKHTFINQENTLFFTYENIFKLFKISFSFYTKTRQYYLFMFSLETILEKQQLSFLE